MFNNVVFLAARPVTCFGPPDRVIFYLESVRFPFPSQSYNPSNFVLELVIDDGAADDEKEQGSSSSDEPTLCPQQHVICTWETSAPELVPVLMHQSRTLARKRIRPQEGIALPVPQYDNPSVQPTE
ncbi:hypothetical protein BWQ96_09867 [Gracilariopsis chorda]|uniref:Uncharacterized protein n=1 Tax=Gracilariopsis chorda TaxID=448386 RepID=A0A2V3IED0_9FLOR|nr:hypothetical protein BWQ96_09867 [Gracilariopsis chorda]|eukprot:PXF40427.1 hypothetical protein BWQ96_09867 [Gracilariopsis chorda]